MHFCGYLSKLLWLFHESGWWKLDSDVEVLECTLTISGILAKVLIDPGSTHTFARPGFIKKLGYKTEILPYLIEVSTPTGERKIETEKVCRNCDVKIKGRKFFTDLILLAINGYDVILGMDWLAQHYVQVDCRTKNLSLNTPGEPIIKLNFKKP